ncbi:ABC transporter substrate-binding protein [Carboxydochorda subterranea]|uniref:ABC transporter substrate-binding protein n=1 Tax=Carboxydichorda subterranea TaxID=3109565 RepID=A0ABZ1BVD6_9FIRM|nr:ABC transporter substrate-binding protein [Limnochorda sp. L945t]WRP16486.1 ABC transporter substrate-binding protein [Limnochorda sp. L945t]
MMRGRGFFLAWWIAALGIVAWAPMGSASTGKTYHIGIVQIVEHPSLDAARKGFVDALAAHGLREGQNVRYDIRNAQGDLSTARLIAQQLVASNVDLILAIATPTAQAAAQATSTIPILITAVTDPVAARLVKSLERPGTNVTGTSDMTPVSAQLQLLKRLLPSARKVGVVYNAGEVNSQVQLELTQQAAKTLGLEVLTASASSSTDVLTAAQSLASRVDAFYVFTDNTVVSALESVIKVAEQVRKPLIVGEGDSVRRGGLATVGIDYYRLGQQTGEMALRVLNGASPAEMPIEFQKDARLVVNLAAASRMGVTIPDAILREAAEVVR